MSTKQKTRNNKNKSARKNKQSVNPAKKKSQTNKTTHKTETIAKPEPITKKTDEKLIKPDPNDREATRAYYEKLSKEKVQQGFRKKKVKEPTVIPGNKVKKNHVKPNIFKSVYLSFKNIVNKQLTKEDYKNIVAGSFAMLIVIAMIIVPLISLFGWQGMGSSIW